MIRFDMPWVPSSLRPNASSPGAWRRKQTAAKAHKADCLILCRKAGLRKLEADKVHLTLRYLPPDRRRRDLDNLLSASKWMVDAIAETIGIDDSRFNYTNLRGEPITGGLVEVTIMEDA